MNIIEKKITELIPYENNPRKNDDAVKYVAESIKEFGFKVPIVIDKNNVIVAGHTRLKASEQLGLKTVPCIVADDLTDEQIKAFRLADNKTSEFALWDFSRLEKELNGIDMDMSAFGFKDYSENTMVIEEDEIPEVEDGGSRVELGSLWSLGEHILLCGSSTDAKDVSKLMDADKAPLLFTSPPYADLREYEGGKDLDVGNICSFISEYKNYAEYQVVNLGLITRNEEIVPYWDAYIDEAHNAGYKLLSWNVWDKTMAGSIGQQKAFFPIRHEWLFVFGEHTSETNAIWEKAEGSVKNEKVMHPHRQPDGTTSYTTKGSLSERFKRMESVFAIRPELGAIRKEHPATFPVELPAEYIKAMTQKGDIVIEPFGGSGTTMIACEQLGRRCRMMELEPKYCEVILKRWETFTGRKAEKIS